MGRWNFHEAVPPGLGFRVVPQTLIIMKSWLPSITASSPAQPCYIGSSSQRNRPPCFYTPVSPAAGLEQGWDFPKIRVPYLGVLIIRILLFRVLYWGPLFSETRYCMFSPEALQLCTALSLSFLAYPSTNNVLTSPSMVLKP